MPVDIITLLHLPPIESDRFAYFFLEIIGIIGIGTVNFYISLKCSLLYYLILIYYVVNTIIPELIYIT